MNSQGMLYSFLIVCVVGLLSKNKVDMLKLP